MTNEIGMDMGNDDVVTSFEQHSYQMERDRQAHNASILKQDKALAAEVKVNVERRKASRWRALGFTGVSIAMACASVGVAYIIWQGVAGPSESQRLEDKWRTMCIEHDGTWIPVDLDSSGSSENVQGMCVSQNSKVEGFGD